MTRGSPRKDSGDYHWSDDRPTMTVVQDNPVPFRVCELRKSVGLPPENHAIGFAEHKKARTE